MLRSLTLQELEKKLEEVSYVTESPVTMALYLATRLQKPLLIEGPAGVGKTEIAKVLARVFDTRLLRLQCYDGLEVSQALYEWNYQHQLMHLKIRESTGQMMNQDLEKEIYQDQFLLKRPLLAAILEEKSVVLLIDEVDRADEAFESFLLEVLSDWQVSIPELGTLVARSRPIVVLTSNATRELSEALRRRCLYLYIDYPSFEKEVEIVLSKVPGLEETLVRQICHFMEELRRLKLKKLPGVAETLDWAGALAELYVDKLDHDLIRDTLGFIIKDWTDKRQVELSLSELLEKMGVQTKL